jgi:serine/threonine-protein kinase
MCDGQGVGDPPRGDAATTQPGSDDAMVGKLVADGKYQIVSVLGKGGMGTVYQAVQPAMKRMVALKLIRADLVTRDDAVARFHKEMMVTARVEHPNTVRVYDFGNDRGKLYLAMEFLAGPSLREVIRTSRSGKLDVVRLVRIARQIAHALGAIHAHGIVHRDLKPDNVILLDSFGERDFVKVLDFGIAKVLEEQLRLTATGKPIGTPTYMAPEQAMGLAVDPRTDLYTLGLMLYQMASGRVPFDAVMTESMRLAHAHESPRPITALVPDLPPALARLIMQLLEKDPGARPATAAEVADRLDRCLPAGAASPARRTWLLAALAAAVVMASAALAYLAFW